MSLAGKMALVRLLIFCVTGNNKEAVQIVFVGSSLFLKETRNGWWSTTSDWIDGGLN
jgi:hypothetical protein